MKNPLLHYSPLLIPIALIALTVAWYEYRLYLVNINQVEYRTHINALQEHVESQEITQKSLSNSVNGLFDILSELQDEYGNISNNLEELEKLSEADPKLLQKYSKIFFLNEHYTPERLTSIPEKWAYHEDRVERIHAEVWPFLEELLEDAKDDDIELFIKSGFRSFEEQANIKSAFTVTYGAGTANTFSADQGYSEHQLGTTVDFMTTGIDGVLERFGETEAYEWLLANAHEYGFTLSYPEGNDYYVFEPWHWRFVGTDLARRLENNDQGFYDLEQRTIDTYLIDLFEN